MTGFFTFNIFLLVGGTLLFTLIFGRFMEKIRVPWVFAALLLGAIFAAFGPSFVLLTSSSTFTFLAEIGMYLLLFLIGLELNVDQMRKRLGFILPATCIIILSEGAIGALVVHAVFGYSWILSFLVALSFATVGEEILIPILQEFNMVNSALGQLIIGIGTVDDGFEIILLAFVSLLIGTWARADIWIVLGSLAAMFLLLALLLRLRTRPQQFRFKRIETLFPFVLALFFVFIGVGSFAQAAPLGAIMAGIGVRLFLPTARREMIESEIKSMAYGFFAPLFFVWVGAQLDIHYLFSSPLIVVLIMIISSGTKMLVSLLVGSRQLGLRGATLLGLGLSVRFSTSIIIIKVLFDHRLIGADVYSVIVASSIVFQFVIPVVFARLMAKWGTHPRFARVITPLT